MREKHDLLHEKYMKKACLKKTKPCIYTEKGVIYE